MRLYVFRTKNYNISDMRRMESVIQIKENAGRCQSQKRQEQNDRVEITLYLGFHNARLDRLRRFGGLLLFRLDRFLLFGLNRLFLFRFGGCFCSCHDSTSQARSDLAQIGRDIVITQNGSGAILRHDLADRLSRLDINDFDASQVGLGTIIVAICVQFVPF